MTLGSCSPISVHVEQLKRCEPRALVRTGLIVSGVVAGVLAAVFAHVLPTYAIGLLAGGGGLFILGSCIDGCRLKPKSVLLMPRLVEWALGKEGDFIPGDDQLLANYDKKTKDGEMLIHLLVKGDQEMKCKQFLTLVQTKRNVSIKDQIHKVGKNGMYPLHYICSKECEHNSPGRLGWVNFFLEQGMNINILTEPGIGKPRKTALDFASELDRTPTFDGGRNANGWFYKGLEEKSAVKASQLP